jgi:hypothetical protein
MGAARGVTGLVTGKPRLRRQFAHKSASKRPPSEELDPGNNDGLTMDRSGADFMVDVIKSLGLEYVASNPGSLFRGLRHRHTGAAINCYLQGSGYSVVEGVKYPWKAGDLMLSVPGWAVHNHASLEEEVYELTVQDSSLNIWMGSLLWPF